MNHLRITTHLQIPGQNKRERWHWASQRREVRAWQIQFNAFVNKPATTKRAVNIISYRRQRFHDEANLIGGCKGLIDGMVRAGLLVDDSQKWATFTYRQELASASPMGRGVPCTVIDIES